MEKHKKRQRSSLLFGGHNLLNSLPRYLLSTSTTRRIGLIAQGWLKEKAEFILFFKIVLVQNSYSAARNLINSVPQQQHHLCLFLCLYPFSVEERYLCIGATLCKWYMDLQSMEASRPLFIRLSLPPGLEEALEGLAREILRNREQEFIRKRTQSLSLMFEGHIILVHLFLFFISSWCNSSFSSYHPCATHLFLHIILV